MSIFKIENNKLTELTDTSFEFEKIYEVRDLQKYLSSSIEIIDPGLLVISTEYSNWEDSKRSIDILCVDSDANLVVMELKRTKDGGHMELQALRYSAMVANMKFEEAVKAYESYIKKKNLTLNAENELLKHFGWSERLEKDFGQDVKIILVSADFSKELTTSVLWLNERDIDIRCIRVKPQRDYTTLYFDIQQIIPLPESSDYQVKLKEKIEEERVVRRENKRAVSIISKLFDSELLQIGQKVILKPAIEQGHSKDLATATIVRKGQNCLRRENDKATYSFSRLRSILTNELALTDVRPEWGFSLKNDWITEQNKELADLEL